MAIEHGTDPKKFQVFLVFYFGGEIVDEAFCLMEREGEKEKEAGV